MRMIRESGIPRRLTVRYLYVEGKQEMRAMSLKAALGEGRLPLTYIPSVLAMCCWITRKIGNRVSLALQVHQIK